MKLTQSDYKKILKYYKLTIPKNHKKTLKKAENIIAKKLCSCIKKVEPKFKKEAPAIGICTKSVIGRKGYKRGKFSCKKRRTIKLYKGGRRNRTCRKGGGNDEERIIHLDFNAEKMKKIIKNYPNDLNLIHKYIVKKDDGEFLYLNSWPNEEYKNLKIPKKIIDDYVRYQIIPKKTPRKKEHTRTRGTKRKRSGGCKSFWNCFKRKSKKKTEEKTNLLPKTKYKKKKIKKELEEDLSRVLQHRKYIFNLKKNIREKYTDDKRRRNEYSKLWKADKEQGRISPTLPKSEQNWPSPLQFVDIEKNIFRRRTRKKKDEGKKTRRKKRRRNKNEGRKCVAPDEINRLKYILDTIIDDYNNNNYDLIGKYLIEYDNSTYKNKYIENKFNNLIYELAPDGIIRSEYFSFIDEEDKIWILKERNLQGCCTISG